MTRENKKPWEKKKRSYVRQVEIREPKKRILIVCEGEKTEPNYFKAFRVSSAVIRIVGLGDNTVNLVNQAIAIRQEAEKNDEGFDQVWCVFDRDSFPAQNFNKALDVAERNSVKIAYSNEAFELWYLLHFNYYDAGISRKEYRRMLTKLLGREYEKNDPKIYDEIFDKQLNAIRNARRLLSQYNPPNPEEDNPSTTVHVLVEALRNEFKN